MVYSAILRRPSGDSGQHRFVLTAPDAESMDILYRRVKDHNNNEAKIGRLGPDFYTWDGKSDSILTHDHEYKIVLTNIPDYFTASLPPTIYNEPRADPISGKSFYIRSKSNRSVYWYCAAKDGGPIVASTAGRTRFKISLKTHEHGTEGTVMIGTDEVYMTKVGAGESSLYVNHKHNKLILEDDERSYPYDNLKCRFLAQGEYGSNQATAKSSSDSASTKTSSDNEAQIHIVNEGLGEQWELVD